MNDYKIYCVYHDTKFINEYNLKETENFKLYYTKDENLNKYNLNYAQLYLCEWVAQYYVWKNNIKSNIIGFCHYRRLMYNYLQVDNNLLNHIKKSQYYSFITGKFETDNVLKHFYITGLGLHIELLKKFINDYYGKFYYDRYNKLINSNNYIQTYGELYLCQWNVFCELTSFFDMYIKYLFNILLNLDVKELYEYNIEDYKKLDEILNSKNWELKEQYNKDNNLKPCDYFFGAPRCLAFMIEFLIGIFFELFYSNKNF